MQNLYDENSIRQSIHTKWAGHTVHFAIETDSTNLWAQRLSREGAPHGTLCVAEYQSAGRGRLGRTWQAPAASSVMMSLLLKPEFAPDRASMLTLVMGLAVAQAVKELGLSAGIKWPNDVVLSRKKVCGILTEMRLRETAIEDVVIGVGLNVNTPSFPPDLAHKATSLRLEGGKNYDRADLIGRIMANLEVGYDRFRKHTDLSDLKEEYEALLLNRNEPVRVLSSANSWQGKALGIDGEGRLLVCKEDGQILPVNAGEVSVRGLYQYV